jgi:UDP-GlcNAc3NAcA epimerase
MKIVTIVGARPQFVKAAAVSRALVMRSEVEEVIVHTGQHHDASMSDIFFEEMKIPKPKYNLGISSLSHGAMTGRMLEKIEEVLVKEKPDWVLVYGDTNSTIAGALAAAKLHIKVAHVEAGLRSFNMQMPEEINRILTDKISNLLFCPTDSAVKNLENEGVSKGVVRTGDIMADALMYYRKQAPQNAKLFSKLPFKNFALSTIHRAENTDSKEALISIFDGLEKVNNYLPVILPLHPRTRTKVESFGIKTNVQIIEPVGYFDMLQLLDNCSIVLTDSGGLQKEAYLCEKPCVTMRNETEWVELLDTGVNALVGTSSDKIVQITSHFLENPPAFKKGLYGDGNAARQILETMLAFRS